MLSSCFSRFVPLKMKLLALCAIVSIVVVSSDGSEDDAKVDEEITRLPSEVEECARQQSLTDMDLHDVKEIIKNQEYNKLTREMRCFTACVFKKQGLIGADGTPHKNFQRPEIAMLCKDLSGKDECEIAIKIVECMHRPELFY